MTSYIEMYEAGGVEVHDRFPESVRTTALAIGARFWEHTRVFGPDGTWWGLSPADPKDAVVSPLRRILAMTVYNPFRTLALRHERRGTYQLSELKQRIREAVQKDDDILTQFMDEGEILLALDAASDFEQIVTLLKRMGEEQDVVECGARS